MTSTEMDHRIKNKLMMIVRKDSSPNSVTILLIFVVAFFSLGLFKNSFTNVLILLAVLFIHELGHSLAMRAFRYRDPNMLFIPLRGTAVSGEEIAPSSSRQALVALAGPVPGIMIGMLFGVVYLEVGHEILIQIGKTFLMINTLNLLPIYPMDGGPFANAVLFSGNRKAELVVQFATALVLVGLSFFLKRPFFALFAVIVFASLFRTSLMSSIAETIRRSMREGQVLSLVPPLSCITQIREQLVRQEFMRRFSPEYLAGYVLEVWGRVCRKPPKRGAAFGLLFIYLSTLILGLFAFFR